MADISKIRIEGTSYTVKDAVAREVTDKIKEQMVDGKLSITVATVKEPADKYPKIATGDNITTVAGKVNKHFADVKDHYDGILTNYILQRQKEYIEGDVAYCPTLPAYCRLVCIQGGTTDSVEPSEFGNVSLDQVAGTSSTIVADSIGDLNILNTANKSSLVGAINELQSTVNNMSVASEEDVQNIINGEYDEE